MGRLDDELFFSYIWRWFLRKGREKRCSNGGCWSLDLKGVRGEGLWDLG